MRKCNACSNHCKLFYPCYILNIIESSIINWFFGLGLAFFVALFTLSSNCSKLSTFPWMLITWGKQISIRSSACSLLIYPSFFPEHHSSLAFSCHPLSELYPSLSPLLFTNHLSSPFCLLLPPFFHPVQPFRIPLSFLFLFSVILYRSFIDHFLALHQQWRQLSLIGP